MNLIRRSSFVEVTEWLLGLNQVVLNISPQAQKFWSKTFGLSQIVFAIIFCISQLHQNAS